MEVTGECSHCGRKVILDLDEEKGVRESRWHLRFPVKCDHCGMVIVAALQDAFNRLWGRGKLFND